MWGYLLAKGEKGQLNKLQNHKPACYDSFAVQEKGPPEKKTSHGISVFKKGE